MSQSEVELYGFVHSLLKEGRGASPQTQRQHERSAYPRNQQIAPYIDGCMPGRSMFSMVRCLDISPSGFSYLAASPFETDQLVVALGGEPHVTYLSAQVIHQTPVTLVGCKFSDRLHTAPSDG